MRFNWISCCSSVVTPEQPTFEKRNTFCHLNTENNCPYSRRKRFFFFFRESHFHCQTVGCTKTKIYCCYVGLMQVGAESSVMLEGLSNWRKQTQSHFFFLSSFSPASRKNVSLYNPWLPHFMFFFFFGFSFSEILKTPTIALWPYHRRPLGTSLW